MQIAKCKLQIGEGDRRAQRQRSGFVAARSAADASNFFESRRSDEHPNEK
jgi:hypothetical protein